MSVIYADPDYLAHHGILGMKWGIRRYQNEDGSLTPAGLRRRQNEVYKQNQAKAKAKTAQTRAQAKIEAMNARNAVRLNKQLLKEQRRQVKDATKQAKTDQANAEEPKNSHGFTRSDIRNMSDKDLQAALNRANNEKQLRQLLEEQKSPLRRALTNAGNTVLSTVVTGGALFATRSLLNSITDSNLGNVVMAAGGKNFMDFQRNSHEEEYDEPKLTRAEKRAAKYEAQTERIKAETARAKAQTDRAKAEQDLKNARTKSKDTGKKESEQNKDTKDNSSKQNKNIKNKPSDSDNSKPAKQDRSQKIKEDAAKQDAYEASRQQQSLAIRPSSAVQTASQSNRGYEAGRRAGQAVGRAMRLLKPGRSSSTPQLPAHTPSNSGSSGTGVLGMKWGVRKPQSGNQSVAPASTAKPKNSSNQARNQITWPYSKFNSSKGQHTATNRVPKSEGQKAKETINEHIMRNYRDIHTEYEKEVEELRRYGIL